MLKLKLENEHVCAALLRNSERATGALQHDLDLKEAQLAELAKMLEKSERIRAQNNELHADELATVKQNLSEAIKRKQLVESENNILKAKVAPSSISSTSSKSLAGRKVRCQCCGEVNYIENGGGQLRGVAGEIDFIHKEQEAEIEKMHHDIVHLKHALSLALKAEQQSRQEAEHFTAASRQACETLQDRISSQLSHLTRAQAENAMVKAQHKFDSCKSESELKAVDQEFKTAHLICRRFYENCANTLQGAGPTGPDALKFEECAAQGLAALLEKLSEWILHQLDVLKTKHINSVAETTAVRSQLTDTQAALSAEKSSAEISHRRIASELLDAQSRIAQMTGSAQQHDATLRELATTQKQLEEVIAERSRLENELKMVFRGVEDVLQEDGDGSSFVWTGQDRGIIRRDMGGAMASAARPRNGRVAELAGSEMHTRPSSISVNVSPSLSGAPKRVNYFKGVLTDKDLSPKNVFLSPKKEVVRFPFMQPHFAFIYHHFYFILANQNPPPQMYACD